MLAELNVEVVTSEITAPKFCGYVVVDGSRIVVNLSPNLSEWEAEFFTRYLTAQAFRLEMSPLPEPFGVAAGATLEAVTA
jgi:hypothetical protein